MIGFIRHGIDYYALQRYAPTPCHKPHLTGTAPNTASKPSPWTCSSPKSMSSPPHI
jgi:hypothetical protein